jgi:hypothetical protein
MKKVMLVICLIYIIFTASCANKTWQGNSDTKNTSIQIATPNSTSLASASVRNPFFFKDSESKPIFKGVFSFDNIVKKDITLNIKKLENLKNGALYELKIESISDIPNERMSLGYFYVQSDKIIKYNATEKILNELKANKDVSGDYQVICQDTEIKDTLGQDEKGFHHSLVVSGDTREYHAFNNQTSTGYYESFIWEKDKGLVNYRSGFGAEKDAIEISLAAG